MNLYPLNLVLAVTVATAAALLGYLPTRLLREEFAGRQAGRLGVGWLAVAAAAPREVFHYYIGLAVLSFVAAWRLESGHPLSGKLWLAAAAALGLGAGPVLILAVVPGAWPVATWARQMIFLLSLYAGGAVPGVAWALWVLTRREATEAGTDARGPARLLLTLALLRLGFAGLGWLAAAPFRFLFDISVHSPGYAFDVGMRFSNSLLVSLLFLALPLMAWRARRRIDSPRPSTAGPLLLALLLLGAAAEALGLAKGIL